MHRKNRLVKVLILSLCSFFVLNSEASAPKYPLLSSWHGQVWLTGKDGKRSLVTRKQILQEKAVLETSASGEVKVQLDEHRAFIVLSSSEVSLPVISFEGGEAPVLFLRAGEFRWEQNLKEKGSYNTALRSDLYEFIAPPGDYVLSMIPSKAYASVKVLNGALSFSAMNAEEAVMVKTGQQVGFQGVLEEGEIAYDILLKGKKIPKGHLTEIKPVDPSELGKREEAEKKRLAENLKKDRLAKALAAKAKKAGYICERPNGRFNDCAWICLNNPKKEKKNCLVGTGNVSCVRQRCNANGEWAEKTLLDAEKASSLCRAEAVVAPCDY